MNEPATFFFADDGAVPNNRLPFLVYKGAFAGPDLVSAIEKTLRRNEWGHGLWHNGIYPFTHYHSQIHEVLGIARGRARVRFGGDQGEETLKRAMWRYCRPEPGTSASLRRPICL